jgi:hypothetical protein
VADYLANGPRYHDALTGADCDPVWTPEGLVRCVDSSALRDPTTDPAYFFADAQCKIPAFFCPLANCDSPPLAVVMEDDGRGGRRATKLASTVQIRGAYGGTNLDTCAFDPQLNLLKIGDTLPWDMFPTLAEKNGAGP